MSSPRGIVVASSIESWKTTPSWEASFDLCKFSSWWGHDVCYSSLGHEWSNNKHIAKNFKLKKLHLLYLELASHINSCTSKEHAHHPSYAHTSLQMSLTRGGPFWLSFLHGDDLKKP